MISGVELDQFVVLCVCIQAPSVNSNKFELTMEDSLEQIVPTENYSASKTSLLVLLTFFAAHQIA